MPAFATFVLFCAVLGGGDDPQSLSLRLKPTALVRGTQVTIGDLCEVAPAGREASELANVAFGPVPGHGYSRTIGRSEILQTLMAQGRDVGNLKIEGATEVAVQGVVVEVAQAEVMEAATAALQAVLATEGGDVEYEAPTGVRQLLAPPGRRSQDISARVRDGRTGPSSAIVDIEVLVDGQSYRKVPLTFKLKRYVPVLKTLGAIRAGTPLGAENCRVEREPQAGAQGLFLDDLGDVGGLVAARDLQANSRLVLSDATPPAVVYRGEIVTVVVTRGRVRVTAKAMANHDAPLGARISLTNLQTRSQITGVVSAPGVVLVNL